MTEQQIFHSVLVLIRYDKYERRHYETAHSLYHRAETLKQAVTDAARFHENRLKAFADDPGFWGTLGCLKVYSFDIQPIAGDGSYCSGRGFAGFEWKCDWPIPLERYIEEIRS